MPLPETLAGKDPCALSNRWLLNRTLTSLIVLLAGQVSRDPRTRMIVRGTALALKIISGFRTVQQQLDLAKAGRPAAPPELSTHTACPATGVDLRIEGHMNPFNNAQDAAIWATVGELAEKLGLRWGGGSPRVSGLPMDFNHFDLGRRRQG